jgi:hypothetical protein
VVPTLIIVQLRKIVNDKIVSSVNLGGPSKKKTAAEAIIASVEATFSRLSDVQAEVDLAFLSAQAAAIEDGFVAALDNGTWVNEIPGRSILQRFAARELSGVGSYEGFRNVIVDQMVDAGYEPPGMRRIIDVISASDTLLPGA